MKKVILLMVIMSLFCGCGNTKDKKENTLVNISTEEVYSMLDDDNTYIIDVRGIDEYNSGHIKNAFNIPVSTITEDIKKEIPVDTTVIVYCMSGNRSKMAGKILLELGYLHVYDMGGINNWNYEIVVED